MLRRLALQSLGREGSFAPDQGMFVTVTTEWASKVRHVSIARGFCLPLSARCKAINGLTAGLHHAKFGDIHALCVA